MNQQQGPERLVAQMKGLTQNIDGFQINSTLIGTYRPFLTEFTAFKKFISDASASLGLKRQSEFYFNFKEAGFTGIVCFTGSYIAIRTNPLSGQVIYDSFISDRFVNNINAAESLYRQTVSFFDSRVIAETYEAL
jgi:S-adenosylmethionine/arginine decarboxylase-like enzyme